MPPPRKVTDAQIIVAIDRYASAHGYAPTVREISVAVGIAVGAVQSRLLKLERASRIHRTRRVARSIMVVR